MEDISSPMTNISEELLEAIHEEINSNNPNVKNESSENESTVAKNIIDIAKNIVNNYGSKNLPDYVKNMGGKIINAQNIEVATLEEFVIKDNIVHNAVIESLIDREGKGEQWDLTLPGHNYLGPGTKFVTKLHNNQRPVDNTDESASEHDYAYVTRPGIESTSDKNFGGPTPFVADTETAIARLALAIKNKLGLKLAGKELSEEEVNAIDALYSLRKNEWGNKWEMTVSQRL